MSFRRWVWPTYRRIKRGEKCLREGDRVVQMVNNYSKDVFNGDVGTVVGVDPATGIAVLEVEAALSADRCLPG